MQECWYHWQEDALIINVRVQPKARRDELVGILENRLKIRLQAPPVEDKANQALIKFLAALCGISGKTSRNKRLRIEAPRQLPEGGERPWTHPAPCQTTDSNANLDIS